MARIRLGSNKAWQCAPLIDKALKRTEMQDRFPLVWVLQRIAEGSAHCWVVYNDRNKITGCIVTMFEHYPNGEQFLDLFTVGGWDMKNWPNDWFDTLRAFAKEKGCTAMTGGGRMGWLKIAPHLSEEIKRESAFVLNL